MRACSMPTQPCEASDVNDNPLHYVGTHAPRWVCCSVLCVGVRTKLTGYHGRLLLSACPVGLHGTADRALARSRRRGAVLSRAASAQPDPHDRP